jgi:hypothetical protein
MDGLHWRDLNAKTSAILHRDIAFLTCLGHLRQRDTDRIISIYVAMPKVAKARTKMSLLPVVVFGIIAALSPM